MTSVRIDRILLGLGALLILISSHQLFFSHSRESLGQKLGTLTSTLSVVKTKNALSLDWRDASSGNDLTENQLIYTDNSSSAEVVFNEGNSLSIGESSLIRIKAQGTGEALDISKGFIRAKLEGHKPLKVQLNGEDYVLSGAGADVQINILDKKGEIGVLTGEVDVVSEGLKEHLTPENALAIDGEKVQKKTVAYTGTIPTKNAVYYSMSSNVPITFSWSPDEEALVVLSKKLSFEKAARHRGVSGLHVELSPGLYYYRIEGKKGTSLINSFRIIQEQAPELIRPLKGDTLDVTEGESQGVLVQWKALVGTTYKLEWNTGTSRSVEVTGGSKVIDVGASEALSWRVKISDEKRPDAIWSEWQDVRIRHISLPVTPHNLLPNEIEYQTYESPNEKIDLSWESSHPVSLEVKDPSGKLTSVKVSETQFTYHATMGGVYSWRVQAFDNFLRTSAWSDWKTFVIEDLSKAIAENGIQRIQLKKPDQSVTFNWKAAPGATSVFELAKASDFKTIIKRSESEKDHIQVTIPVTGTFYWRSRQYLPDGTVNVSEPKRVIIEPVPAPERPEKLPDLEVPLKEIEQKSSFLNRCLNLLIPSAYAEEVRGMVQLTLPVKDEAKAYIVRIYRDEELTDLVFEQEISEKRFEWKNAEPGNFYWQYAVVDFWDRRSLFSEPSHLTVTEELVPLPDKPKLLFPIRATAVEEKNLEFSFSETEHSKSYSIEVSSDKEFSKPLLSKKVKGPRYRYEGPGLSPGLYYWRVIAFNSKSQGSKSNTGRFIIPPPLEKIIIADIPAVTVETKRWKNRAFISWNPSLDSYTFKDGETGKISGTALMGFAFAGTMFKKETVFNAEILRQSGKVFKGESYLFQRGLLDGVKTWKPSETHLFGIGIAVGQVSGMSYSIKESGVVSSGSRGVNFGPILRDYYVLNKNWELQSKLLYLVGGIKQMEGSVDAMTHVRNYLVSVGTGYALRTYDSHSGEQSSLKLSFGIGKEF